MKYLKQFEILNLNTLYVVVKGQKILDYLFNCLLIITEERGSLKAWVKIYHKTLIKTKWLYCLCLIFFPFCLRILIKKKLIQKRNKKVETYRKRLNKMNKNGRSPLLSTCISVSNFKINIFFYNLIFD